MSLVSKSRFLCAALQLRNLYQEEQRMAKRKVELSDDQKSKNQLILARIEAEKRRLFEETRALQQQFRRNIKRRRATSGAFGEIEEYGDRAS